VLVLLAAITGYRYVVDSRSSKPFVTAAVEPVSLNLKDSSVTRGDANAPQKDVPVLPRRSLDLTIVLPFGSEPGTYQFQLLEADGHVLKSGDAPASVLNGDTSLKTRLNTTNLSAGDYQIGLREQSFDWVRYPIRLR
jgi:hypothetical protein